MERNEMINKLSKISCITCNLAVTNDMGLEFEVMTSKGVCGNIGNIGNWPCYILSVTEELKELKIRILNGEEVTVNEMLEVKEVKQLFTYSSFLYGSYVVEGELLEKCAKNFKDNINNIDTNNDVFYAYAELEDWDDGEIMLFSKYEELSNYFRNRFGDDDVLYEDMTDEELMAAFDNAKNEDWDGIYLKDYTNKE